MSLLERIARWFEGPVVGLERRAEITRFMVETTYRMHPFYPKLLVPLTLYEQRRDGAVAAYRHGDLGTVVLDVRFAGRKPLPVVLDTVEHELAHAYCAQVYGAGLPDHDHRFRDMLALIRAA